MKLTLDSIELFKNHRFPQLVHGEAIIQLGSCFSTNMSIWFRKAGFEVMDNPFGVIFHPIVLADHLKLALGKGDLKPLIQRDDIWLSYDAGSKLYAFSETELETELRKNIHALREQLKSAKQLMITFGTAHGYVLNETETVVANCHQQPGNHFIKKLFTAAELFIEWEKLLIDLVKEHPNLELTFIVSPVRYTRDGIIENNQSKAALIELVRLLQERFPSINYFPSYELVIDILRDYRFFERDLVHPNELAIDEVWELCYAKCFTEETQQIIKSVLEFRQMEAHKLLFPESVKSAEFLSKFNAKKSKFLAENRKVVW